MPENDASNQILQLDSAISRVCNPVSGIYNIGLRESYHRRFPVLVGQQGR
jgi:hypothetical protein